MKLLKFYSPSCAPCKGLAMVIDGVKDTLPMPVQDVNIEDDFDMAAKYRIRSVPTVVIIDDNETEIKRFTGLVNEEQLLQFVNI